MQPQLPFHEWLIVSLIILIMLGLTIVTYVHDHKTLPQTTTPHELEVKNIRVTIQGSVSKPGSYTLPKGASINDLLTLAVPLEEANLKGLKRKNKLKPGQIIDIPSQSLTIYVEGAVKFPGPIEVPKGTLLQDIPNFIRLESNADLKSLQKSRKLKDQERILISTKQHP